MKMYSLKGMRSIDHKKKGVTEGDESKRYH